MYYQGRIRCDDFNEATMKVGDQRRGESLTSREKRKLARQQVASLVAGLVVGLNMIDDDKKAQVIQKTREWHDMWVKQC
eukprot:4678432-Alexandrium_andersonii.AAC.1